MERLSIVSLVAILAGCGGSGGGLEGGTGQRIDGIPLSDDGDWNGSGDGGNEGGGKFAPATGAPILSGLGGIGDLAGRSMSHFPTATGHTASGPQGLGPSVSLRPRLDPTMRALRARDLEARPPYAQTIVSDADRAFSLTCGVVGDLLVRSYAAQDGWHRRGELVVGGGCNGKRAILLTPDGAVLLLSSVATDRVITLLDDCSVRSDLLLRH